MTLKETFKQILENWVDDDERAVSALLQAVEGVEEEAYKRGYVQGGVDEILRHERATETVEANLKESKRG